MKKLSFASILFLCFFVLFPQLLPDLVSQAESELQSESLDSALLCFLFFVGYLSQVRSGPVSRSSQLLIFQEQLGLVYAGPLFCRLTNNLRLGFEPFLKVTHFVPLSALMTIVSTLCTTKLKAQCAVLWCANPFLGSFIFYPRGFTLGNLIRFTQILVLLRAFLAPRA